MIDCETRDVGSRVPDDHYTDCFMTRRRWMALCFALGSTCFFVGPFPGYANLVGDAADGVTFFVGSILFTAGGGLQSWLAWPERSSRRRSF